MHLILSSARHLRVYYDTNCLRLSRRRALQRPTDETEALQLRARHSLRALLPDVTTRLPLTGDLDSRRHRL